MVENPDPSEAMRRIGPKPIAPPAEGLGPDEKEFQSLMQGAPAKGTSPLEAAGKKTAAPPPSMEGLIRQMDATDEQIKKMQGILNFPKLKLKKSHERLINTKLQNAVTDIEGAAKASKTKILPKVDRTNMQPVSKFLSFVGDGHNQLKEVKGNLAAMIKKKKKISPANMLLMQVKIAQAQQEIEFSSILLSKVVEGIRQTLNIQIQ